MTDGRLHLIPCHPVNSGPGIPLASCQLVPYPSSPSPRPFCIVALCQSRETRREWLDEIKMAITAGPAAGGDQCLTSLRVGASPSVFYLMVKTGCGYSRGKGRCDITSQNMCLTLLFSLLLKIVFSSYICR